MSGENAPVAVGPQAYAAWRESSLGSLTEALELRVMIDLMGSLKVAEILDVGCGDGALACAAALRGAGVTAVDPDPAMLAAARERAARLGASAQFVAGRVERLPFPDGAFDLAAAMTVLCFVADASAALREIARVLRPGGALIVGELGRWSLWAATRRMRGWLGSATWKAARFRSATELRSLAVHAGLSVDAVRGAIFYPPADALARLTAPIDARLGRVTTLGAAFVALRAVVHREGRR